MGGTRTIVGIDPGLAGTGIGLVSGRGLTVTAYSFGSIRTSQSESLARRLDLIYSRLGAVLRDQVPDLMVVEDVFSLERFPKSGILLGKVTGVVLLAAAHHNIPVVEVSVRESKKILSGNGNADKEQLERAVRRYLDHGTPIRPFHASDALALALIGLFRY
ncbi:crossover junction endodeoxyribonuclease RuvC [Desulfatiferula olefinivorans]